METDDTGPKDLLDALRRRWVTALLVALPLFAGVLLYERSQPDEYEGAAVVSFAPRGTEVGADLIRVLVPKYVAYLTSRPTARTIANELAVDEDDIFFGTDVSVTPDTANLTVTVRLDDGLDAATAANALAREAVTLSTIDEQLEGRIVSRSIASPEPAGPPRRLIDLGGLVLAALAGFTAALLRDRSRPLITDALTLALVSGHGVLGRVPRARALKRPVAGWLVDTRVGAAVRSLRTSLGQRLEPDGLKVIAITSATSGEGKTTVAAAIAAAQARVDVRVLIIDADMRRPRVHGVFGLDPEPAGLAELLDGTATLRTAARRSGLPGLDVVTTRPREDAGDLLARHAKRVLDEARAAYDLVIVDCPPVLATDDARTLALLCEGTVLVARRGTDSTAVSGAAATLDGLGVTVLGTVLNGARIGRSSDLGGYGGYAGARR